MKGEWSRVGQQQQQQEGLQPSAAPYGGGRGDESENKNRNPKPQRITESPCHCNFGGTCAATSRDYVNFVRLHSGKWQGGRNQEGEKGAGVRGWMKVLMVLDLRGFFLGDSP